MQPNFNLWNVIRFAKATGLALALCLVVSLFGVPASAQRDRDQVATDRCQQEIRHRMTREFGGSRPDVMFGSRDAQLNQISYSETGVRGTGRYTRDSYDRGRSFSYDCVYNSRNGRVTSANYRWSGGGSGGGGLGPISGVNRPEGRVRYSGAITNRNSGKALDVQERGVRDKANVQQWSFADQPNQRWEVIDLGNDEFAIISQGSGKVLDVSRASARDEANVQQYHWNGGENQRWRLERVGGGYYKIVNVGSGKCLDVAYGSRDNGANVQQYDCHGRNNQQWKLGK